MVVLSSVVKLPVDNDDPTLLEGLKGPQVWGRRVTGESGKVLLILEVAKLVCEH